MYSPVIVEATTTDAVQNGTISLDPDKLQNPYKTPMFIDEFRLYGLKGSAGPFLDTTRIDIKIQLGSHFLTKDFVDVRLLGKILSSADTDQGGGSRFPVWRLDKPLWMDPDMALRVWLRSEADGAGTAYNIPAGARFSMVGRSLPTGAVPDKGIVYYPWATQFSTPWRVCGTSGIYVDESNETQLVNPFDHPLNVSYFMGMTNLGGAVSPVPAYVNIPATSIQVRMSTSNGSHAVRDPVPLPLLFSRAEGMWPAKAVLDPKGFFLATIDENYTPDVGIVASGANGPYTYTGLYVRNMISMIGHHEVKIR